MAIIYCIKGITNNYIYIGKSIQSMNSRKSKHIYDSKKEHRIKHVHRVILANGGFCNFQFKILKIVDDNLLLSHYEKKIIDDYKNNEEFILMNKQLL